MADHDPPQIYLISPPEIDPAIFPDVFSSILKVTDIACVRLALSSQDEEELIRSADFLRELAHSHDVPLVIEDHVSLVPRLGLDGVHLTDGSQSVRSVRKELGADAIVGTFCGTSRHAGMTAAEAGADYVSFGPIVASTLGHGAPVELDLFKWWSEMIEVPVVAEGGLNEDGITKLSDITDFIAIGPEIWTTDDPTGRLSDMIARLG